MKGGKVKNKNIASNLLAKLFSSYREDFKQNERAYHFSLGFRLQNNVNSLDALELAYSFGLLESLIHKEKMNSVKRNLIEIKTAGIFSLYKDDSPQHEIVVKSKK